MATRKPLALVLRPRGSAIKNLPVETYAVSNDTCDQLYQRIAAKSHFPIERLRITKGSDGSHVPNSKKITVEEMGLYEKSTLFVKDLGPQIAWRTVFIIEYLGPLMIHPLLYLMRPYVYRNHLAPMPYPKPSYSQTLSLTLIMLHFLKRELETIYVHRFSAATMPVKNIFKNSFHYWILAGLNIALFTYSPSPECPTSHPLPNAWIGPLALALFGIGEIGNLSCHLTLKNLRSAGTAERGIPNGWEWRVTGVTCPNYFFEMLAWIGILLSNRSLSTALFAVVAVGQMYVWAKKKESRYRKEFGSKYRRRRCVMIPFIA